MPKRIARTEKTGKTVLKLALCQVRTEEWAVSENLRRTLSALEEAAARGAQLAITPECVLHGYASNNSKDFRRRMMRVAERLDGPNLTLLRRTAQELKLDTIVGFAERGEGRHIHNSAALISREGEILSVYRKVHLRRFEASDGAGAFTPGADFHVTKRRLRRGAYRLGVMICFDREVTESVRCLRSLGAELVACPLATDTYNARRPGERADNEMVTRVRAAENEVFIAVVNHARRFNGGSFVVGPQGEVLHQMGPEEGVSVIDVPVGVVRRNFHSHRHGWMGWGFRRPEVYAPYLA